MTQNIQERSNPGWLCRLLGIVTICALAIGTVRGIRFALEVRQDPAVVQEANTPVTDANTLDEMLQADKDRAEALKTENLFAPPPPKRHPVQGVDGIIGQEALINDRLYKVGDQVEDARIIEINPLAVIVEWDGQRKTFSPFEDFGGGPGDEAKPKRGGSERGRSGPERSSGHPPMMDPEKQKAMMEEFKNASPERRREMMETFRQSRREG